MSMRQIVLLFIATFSFGSFGQTLPSYYLRTGFLNGAATTFQDGLLGFANPATPGLVQNFNMRFHWATQRENDSGIGDWAFYSATRGLGFAMQRQEFGDAQVKDYRLTMAGETNGNSFGFGLQWSGDATENFDRETMLSVGWILRPTKFLSLGIVGNKSLESRAREGILEAGIRPFGNHWLTLFGDMAIQRKERLDEAPWSAGAALQLVPGIDLTGRFFDNEAFTVGLNISMGEGFFGFMDVRDPDQERINRAYSIGFGDSRPSSFADVFTRGRGYMSLELKGRVDYLNYVFFDDGTIKFLHLLESIRAAANDPRIGTVALNLSALRILPEHAWEVRTALQDVQKSGKKVVVFIDRAGMVQYHLASVADVVMFDPQGSLMLPGYIMGRTYLKGTLEKLGLGFEPFQYFKYKSAVESLYLDSLSTGDREQRQALVDNQYELIRDDVCLSRSLNPETFDSMIDEQVYFSPQTALKNGLVDTLARWDELGGILKKLNGKNGIPIPRDLVDRRSRAIHEWGPIPTVAIVYALGECAMDRGINARRLRKVIDHLAKSSQVRAVILRVDSPGGDGMASDYVAEALKKCAEKKPVIISQGQVAASGGYWVSMYGDRILAGPNTITGSIGVIAGWIYNKGLTEKIGMTADYVKRGDHADMAYGVTIPFLGLRIPARNVTEDEQERVRSIILGLYDEFVDKVADGRDLPVDSIRALAQGRVYPGSDGLTNGLIDEIGGLQSAIAVARNLADIKDGQKIRLAEFPNQKGFFNSGAFSPISVKEPILDESTLRFLQLINERPGYPLPMLLPGDYPVLPESGE